MPAICNEKLKIYTLPSCAALSFESSDLSELAHIKKNGYSLYPLPFQKVSCGLFGISEDYIEKYISLDDKIIKDKEATFLFRAQSFSMQPNIQQGDILVVDRSMDAQPGQVVVFSFNGEMLCKRLAYMNGEVFFKSDNPDFKPIQPKDSNEFLIFGVVRAIVRENP